MLSRFHRPYFVGETCSPETAFSKTIDVIAENRLAGCSRKHHNLRDGRQPKSVVTTWLGTATILFAARSADYGGMNLDTAAEVLTLASTVGTVVTIIFAFRAFWRATSADSGLALFGLACSPFIVGALLALNGTEPNFHDTSMGGLLFYGLLVEITAATLSISRAFSR
jgi:hypothetical protein